ncbi:metallophosphoesterase family protein [Microbulbifer zhoushanensis]|uniref:metallophosphoesterase family protein n=1 Tax=Microbulbifer zhoushanensis TaxID=2904254 RepID=UPI001F2CBF71|nr:metallophosphoesterase [Microbulbifer zhoushanensis]
MSTHGKAIKIIVLSDIHPTMSSLPELGESHLKIDQSEETYNNPFAGLFTLVSKESIEADIILCAGDLGTRAHPLTIKYTWDKLQELKEKAKAQALIVTPGNHDHDSRSKYLKYDPKGFLQSLTPPFPYDFGDENSHFWAWNFDIIEHDNARIITLNSSAYHGISDEYLYGRVTEITINKIKNKLASLPEKPINILLCHHHFHKNEEIKVEDYDAMEGASRLMAMLSEEATGDWMLIHGHKHFPKIYYGQSSYGQSPIIFSAGSFSGDTNGELGTVASNQVYLLEFNLEEIENYGLVGKFKTWDWAHGRGWLKASDRSGIPHEGGFGCQAAPKLLLKELQEKLNGKSSYSRDEIVCLIPQLQFLTPMAVQKLKQISEENLAFEVFTSSGQITEISKIKRT